MDNTGVKNNVILTVPVNRKPNSKRIAGGRVKTVGQGLLSKVRPFRFAMLLSLQRKGIAVRKLPFKAIVALFFNNFCTNNFGVGAINVSEFSNNIAFKVTKSEENEIYGNGRLSSSVNQVSEVAAYVIAQFQNSAEKYQTALDYGYDPVLTLTDDEILQAKALKRDYNRLRKEETEDHYLKVSEVKPLLKWILIFAVLYYIAKSL